MTGAEIKKQIQSIMHTKLPEHQKLELLRGFIEQQQREAFATGKATAYKEMFSVIRKMADARNTKEAPDSEETAGADVSE